MQGMQDCANDMHASAHGVTHGVDGGEKVSTLGVASVLTVGASNREAGSVVSQFWYLGGKSMERTWPMTDVILKWAARPWKLPSHSCTSR